MIMGADALKLLQETAQKALAPEVLKIPGDGRTVFVHLNGKIERFAVLPPPRHHVVHTLDDLIRFAESLEPEFEPVVFHNTGQVVLLLDKNDRRDVVAFALKFTNAFQLLCRLNESPVAYDQRSFCRLLQFDLGVDKATVAKFRNLDWATQVAVRGETAAGRDRLGKEVLASVKGDKGVDLPEEITIAVSVYQNPGERDTRSLRCAIEMETAVQKLILLPFPDEIDLAIEAAQASIHERLIGRLKDDPVYSGRPMLKRQTDRGAVRITEPELARTVDSG